MSPQQRVRQGVPIRAATYNVLEGTSSSRIGRVVSFILASVIVLNVGALTVETVDRIYQVSPRAFWTVEVVSVAIFTIEYVLRVWSCTADPRYSHPVYGRARFAITPIALLDLLAILPFYGQLLGLRGLDLRVLRTVRLVARIARLTRLSSGFNTLVRVVTAKRSELSTVIVVLLVLLLLTSSLMYFAEHEAQPDVFSSIPETMWWSIITLTTVGYGDMTPVTFAGRILAGLMAVLGIGLFALPAGILGSGFVDELSRNRACPHCGRRLAKD